MASLAHYLFHRLEQCGVDCTFGIPGDFALPLYAQQEKYGMKTVVCTHEPSCVYAADAYSRLKGIGAVLTTYGVGGLNMINPVAMAYAEYSPVIVISGAPAIQGRKKDPAFHHLVKDYGTQQRVFAEVTCTTASLTSPETAAAEIDRVLDTCLRQKRPGYIEIPRDMTALEIPVPPATAACTTGPTADPPAIKEAINEILHRFARAQRPVLYAGVGIRRNGLTPTMITLAENWGMPVVSSVMGKASFPESHPNHAGLYMGQMGDAHARDLLENADLVLSVGVIYSDVNTGFWTADIATDRLIDSADTEVQISSHTYHQVPMALLMRELAVLTPTAKQLPPLPQPASAPPSEDDTQLLTTAQLITALQSLDQRQYSFLADVGDAWFVGLELDADTFMAPGYYASMGFSVPGALGAALAAPDLRPVVLVGDGAFQMTGAELSTHVVQKLRPIVIILNNSYYKMLAVFDGHREYYSLNNWEYVQYARAMGCEGKRATTAEELRQAMAEALLADKPFIIEAILQKEDHAPMMLRIKDFFNGGPTHTR